LQAGADLGAELGVDQRLKDDLARLGDPLTGIDGAQCIEHLQQGRLFIAVFLSVVILGRFTTETPAIALSQHDRHTATTYTTPRDLN